MRYRKSPLDDIHKYVKIQKSVLRLTPMAESWFLWQNICFWESEI